MKNKIILIPLLVSILLISGCIHSGELTVSKFYLCRGETAHMILDFNVALDSDTYFMVNFHTDDALEIRKDLKGDPIRSDVVSRGKHFYFITVSNTTERIVTKIIVEFLGTVDNYNAHSDYIIINEYGVCHV